MKLSITLIFIIIIPLFWGCEQDVGEQDPFSGSATTRSTISDFLGRTIVTKSEAQEWKFVVLSSSSIVAQREFTHFTSKLTTSSTDSSSFEATLLLTYDTGTGNSITYTQNADSTGVIQLSGIPTQTHNGSVTGGTSDVIYARTIQSIKLLFQDASRGTFQTEYLTTDNTVYSESGVFSIE